MADTSSHPTDTVTGYNTISAWRRRYALASQHVVHSRSPYMCHVLVVKVPTMQHHCRVQVWNVRTLDDVGPYTCV